MAYGYCTHPYIGCKVVFVGTAGTGDGGLLAALDEGPARLDADQVAASQRRRIIAAMIATTAEKGYAQVSVADVVARARVSRATFYEQFADKAECFLAAFHACSDQIVESSLGRTERATDPYERLHQSLVTYLNHLASFPEGTRVCLVEIYAIGPEGPRHRRKGLRGFIDGYRRLHDGFKDAGEPVHDLSDFDLEMIVGAISSLVTNRVGSGDVAELPSLVPQIEAFVLMAFGLRR